jgi:hypothetical protein
MTIREYRIANPSATDAQVAAALSATTYGKVPLAALAVWLTLAGRMSRFRDAALNDALPKELRDGVTDLVDAINNPRLENLDLTIDEIRQRWIGGAQALGAISVLTADESAELQAMGRTDTVVTEADVSADRIREAAESLRAQWAAIYNAGVTAIDAGTATTLNQLREVVA